MCFLTPQCQSDQQHNANLSNAENQSQQVTNTEGSNISYRERRRVQQSQNENGKRTRGRTRGVKWRKERKRALGVKPSCQITKNMKRIVGDKADQFITKVGHWVRTILSLRCRRWSDLSSECKDRLFLKIKAEWILPEGDNVGHVVEYQCKVLYRQWRYRLKEEFFDGYSIADAVKNCPKEVDKDEWKWLVEKHWGSDKQKRISEVNRRNRSKQKSKALQGSKSTARVLEMLRKTCVATSRVSEQGAENTQEGNESESPPSPIQPEYVRLWEQTKRRKDKSMDKFAEGKLEEFKQLHQDQLELYGVDNLTVEEAYIKVLGTCSGYINGLGYGPKPPKVSREGSFFEENAHFAHQMAEQFDQLEKASQSREHQLNEQIQGLQKENATMLQEMEKMKKDAEVREEQMKKGIEEKLRLEFQEMMKKQFSSIASGQLNLQK